MYYAVLAVGMIIAYLILYKFFPYFLEGRRAALTSRSFVSAGIILFVTLGGFAVSIYQNDLEWGNRLLHGFNGGFVTFMICFLAARDSKVNITKFQFWVLAGLIVTSLGVMNELIEMLMQYLGVAVFLRAADDTWLDLFSNTVGILVATVCFVPFSAKKKISEPEVL